MNGIWSYNMKQLLISIEIENIDESLITKWIVNDMLKKDLKYCLHIMQHILFKDFHIYTDSSLDTSEFNVTDYVVIGAGWILKGSELSFEYGILNFPSSTRPEILAIFTAIFVILNNNKLTIYSDNQAAIDSISLTLSHDV
jgi:hypothetical protein